LYNDQGKSKKGEKELHRKSQNPARANDLGKKVRGNSKMKLKCHAC